MIEKVKQIRIALDSLASAGYPKGRYFSLAVTSLETGRLFLGKVLGALGTEYPYPHGSDTTSPVIDPATDKSEKSFDLTALADADSIIMSIKTIRSKIEDHFKSCFNSLDQLGQGTPAYFFMSQAATEIIKAKMWFGLAMAEVDASAPKKPEETEPESKIDLDSLIGSNSETK